MVPSQRRHRNRSRWDLHPNDVPRKSRKQNDESDTAPRRTNGTNLLSDELQLHTIQTQPVPPAHKTDIDGSKAAINKAKEVLSQVLKSKQSVVEAMTANAETPLQATNGTQSDQPDSNANQEAWASMMMNGYNAYGYMDMSVYGPYMHMYQPYVTPAEETIVPHENSIAVQAAAYAKRMEQTKVADWKDNNVDPSSSRKKRERSATPVTVTARKQKNTHISDKQTNHDVLTNVYAPTKTYIESLAALIELAMCAGGSGDADISDDEGKEFVLSATFEPFDTHSEKNTSVYMGAHTHTDVIHSISLTDTIKEMSEQKEDSNLQVYTQTHTHESMEEIQLVSQKEFESFDMLEAHTHAHAQVDEYPDVRAAELTSDNEDEEDGTSQKHTLVGIRQHSEPDTEPHTEPHTGPHKEPHTDIQTDVHIGVHADNSTHTRTINEYRDEIVDSDYVRTHSNVQNVNNETQLHGINFEPHILISDDTQKQKDADTNTDKHTGSIHTGVDDAHAVTRTHKHTDTHTDRHTDKTHTSVDWNAYSKMFGNTSENDESNQTETHTGTNAKMQFAEQWINSEATQEDIAQQYAGMWQQYYDYYMHFYQNYGPSEYYHQ